MIRWNVFSSTMVVRLDDGLASEMNWRRYLSDDIDSFAQAWRRDCHAAEGAMLTEMARHDDR
jgi:hypothetical protein